MIRIRFESGGGQHNRGTAQSFNPFNTIEDEGHGYIFTGGKDRDEIVKLEDEPNGLAA